MVSWCQKFPFLLVQALPKFFLCYSLPVMEENIEPVCDIKSLVFDCKSNVQSLSLTNILKSCLLRFAVKGADLVLMDRKLSKVNRFASGIGHDALLYEDWRSSSQGCHGCSELASGSMRGKNSNNGALQENDSRLNSKMDIASASNLEVVNCPPRGNYVIDFPLNFLALFVVLLTRFAGFQFNLLVSFFTFPIWLSYLSCSFVMFPFQIVRHIKGYVMKKLFSMVGVSKRRITNKAHQSMGNVAERFGCALFWSSYAFMMLLGLLGSGFLFGCLIMMQIVEKPIQLTETLNFDYTRPSPVAFVPLMPYSGVNVNIPFGDEGKVEAAGKQDRTRAIPYNHKLLLTVSLVMPESDYNRKLGVFQVKVEFLSTSGKVTASSSHPCILRFKSQPVRFAETILQSVPLITGVQTESQILNINMNEITEGLEPTAFLKVILEQRAEYRAGAGIPEIYAASLSLESELPQLKRFIRNWRRTITVWVSIALFLTELMLALVFCRPILLPKGNPRILYVKKEVCPKISSGYQSSCNNGCQG